MNFINYQKTSHLFYVAGIASLITIPDLVFGLLIDVILHLFELGHLIFEFIEETLDHYIEHTFHTNRQQTQFIVFYLMMTVAAYGVWHLWKIMPTVYRQTRQRLIDACARRKLLFQAYWSNLSIIGKLKWLALFNACIVYLYFFSF